MDPKAIADDFLSVIKNHYFDMMGRVRRQDFWYFVLASAIVMVVAGILGSILPSGGILYALVGLALLLPIAGMGARRLQDTGKDGKLVWAFVIPFGVEFFFTLLGAIFYNPYGPLGFVYFVFEIRGLIDLILFVALIACVYFWVQDGTPGPNQYGADPKGRTATA